jgi:hypothetical protein
VDAWKSGRKALTLAKTGGQYTMHSARVCVERDVPSLSGMAYGLDSACGVGSLIDSVGVSDFEIS